MNLLNLDECTPVLRNHAKKAATTWLFFYNQAILDDVGTAEVTKSYKIIIKIKMQNQLYLQRK